ncbi:O-antigen/teichoic acid export membrane protein [Lewinella aquimaris]|uniref:O-antigen/teichoic acid export membrane protein n=1 Tax=Neolewinella aquimaris TaxID=1835722 RepID=A0A840E4U2_9BACT|nr:polysaccharide biosynthesis C-terminal domain-containing protein [Neolewinella aquimaris]MBB4080201.1 O-antigen/teichoic acid export membrane protein [Neolewinella aquimaris]
MGVIQRQTIKNNAVSLLGVGIGAVSQLLIYPLDVGLKGHIDGVVSFATLLVPFLLLGMPAVMVRYLPYLTGEDEVRGAGQLLTRSLVVATIALLVVTGLNFLLGDRLAVGQGVLDRSRWTIIGVAAALVYAAIFTSHLLNFQRIALPVVFNNLLIKVGAPILVLAAVYGYLSQTGVDVWLILLYAAAAVGLILYAWRLKVVRLVWGRLGLGEVRVRSLYGLALFSVFGAIGGRLAAQLDTVSINTLLGDVDTGIYAIAKYVMNVIVIPTVAINAITSPIVAKAWRDRDMSHLGFLYKETAMVLYAVGGLIYVGAVVCMPYVYGLTDGLEAYRIGYASVLFLGGAQLFDLMTSINGNLIGMTDYYRWNVLLILVLGVFNVFLNYFFIAVLGYGMTGAALSTFVSLFLYNVLKVGFVYWKMRLHPLTTSLLYTTIALAVCGVAGWFLPLDARTSVQVIVRGTVICALFYGYLRFTSGVPALRRLLTNGVGKMFT